MKFTQSHEWVEEEQKGILRVGITAYIQKELGEIVYVELPQIGKEVHAGKELAILESTKAATDVYSPVTGTIIEVNERLKENPELINTSSEQEGWICCIRLSDVDEKIDWMNRAAYEAMLKGARSSIATELEYAIDVRELTHDYGTIRAVDNLSFQVKKGTIFGLLGPNGAGKSTTIKMLTTLLPPTSGTALLLENDLVRHPEQVRKQIGYVPQLISADGDLTGYENLRLSAKLYGLDRETREKSIKEALDFMGLSHAANQMVNEYSGGMIRRLELARALIHYPRILFLDEPSVGLDPSARKMIWGHIQEWQKKFATTVFMTTHDMEEADKVCDCIGFMYFGRLVAIDSPTNLKQSIGPGATLDDVFIKYTGASIQEGAGYAQTKQRRQTISHLG